MEKVYIASDLGAGSGRAIVGNILDQMINMGDLKDQAKTCELMPVSESPIVYEGRLDWIHEQLGVEVVHFPRTFRVSTTELIAKSCNRSGNGGGVLNPR